MHRNKQGSNQRQGRSMDDLYQCHQQAHRDVGWNGVGKVLHRVFLALVSLIHRPAQHPDSFDTMQREQKLRGAIRIQHTIRRVACMAEALVIVSVSVGFGSGCGPTVREGSSSNS